MTYLDDFAEPILAEDDDPDTDGGADGDDELADDEAELDDDEEDADGTEAA